MRVAMLDLVVAGSGCVAELAADAAMTASCSLGCVRGCWHRCSDAHRLRPAIEVAALDQDRDDDRRREREQDRHRRRQRLGRSADADAPAGPRQVLQQHEDQRPSAMLRKNTKLTRYAK